MTCGEKDFIHCNLMEDDRCGPATMGIEMVTIGQLVHNLSKPLWLAKL